MASPEMDIATGLAPHSAKEDKPNYDDMSFKEAFAAARKANPTENFTWRGKSFNTKLAEESRPKKAAPARPRAKPAALPKGKGREAWAGIAAGSPTRRAAPKGPSPLEAAKATMATNFEKARRSRERHQASANNPRPSGYAKGGSVRGNGCAKRGHGKGRMV